MKFNLRNRVDGDFVTFSVRLLNSRVIGVFVGNEVSGLDIASIGIFALAIEYFFVEVDVVVVDGIIESDSDHLRYIPSGQVTGDHRAVLGAEAVGQYALAGIARWGSIGVVVDICHKQITPIKNIVFYY